MKNKAIELSTLGINITVQPTTSTSPAVSPVQTTTSASPAVSPVDFATNTSPSISPVNQNKIQRLETSATNKFNLLVGSYSPEMDQQYHTLMARLDTLSSPSQEPGTPSATSPTLSGIHTFFNQPPSCIIRPVVQLRNPASAPNNKPSLLTLALQKEASAGNNGPK